MAFDVEAAKANGYTDEEIQQYLASKDQPLPQEKPIDRTEEYMGMAQTAIPTAIELGAAGYGAKKLIDAFRGPTGPATPPATGATQRIAQSMLGSPNAMAPGAVPTPAAVNPATSPSWTAPAAAQQAQAAQAAAAQANPTANNFIQRMSMLAKQYSPAAARLGVGAGAALYSGGLNTNEEQELARRRQMGFIR